MADQPAAVHGLLVLCTPVAKHSLIVQLIHTKQTERRKKKVYITNHKKELHKS
jgi:hypothetical protein